MSDIDQIGELTIDRDRHVVFGPGDPDEASELPGIEAVRMVARVDAGGAYRPLSGARSLPGSWCITYSTTQPLDEIVDAVYPLASTHRRRWRDGDLRTADLEAVIARQAGRYRSASELDEPGRERATALVCGECVRTPVWRHHPPIELGRGDIPCPEPCSVLLAFVREAASWQRERPEPATIDPAVPYAAFETPGNALRERFLLELSAPTPAQRAP